MDEHDATGPAAGTDSDTGNCTTIPHSHVPAVTNLLESFGRALNVTEPLPGSLLSAVEGWHLARIRRTREAKQMVLLNDVDFLLQLLKRFGA